VADYPRIKTELDSLITKTPGAESQPGGSGPGDPVAAAAIRRESLAADVRAVEKAFSAVPEEYAMEIFKHLVEGEPYPDYANRKVWYYWQQVYLYNVATLRGY